MGKRNDVERGTYNMVYAPPPPPYAPPAQPWCPWLVPLIFGVNVSMFVYTMYVNDCPAHTDPNKCVLYDQLGRYSFQPLKENLVLGPSIATLRKLGALDPTLVVEKGEGWRLFSCIWLHAGLVHLCTNMLSLLFIGIQLEQEFGFLRIGLLYVLSGFGGSLMSSINTEPFISVGASGALLGLLGAMLSELITNWTIYTNKCAAITTLLFISVLNLALGLIPHVDSSAHTGGFIAGFLAGFILLMRPQFGYVSRKYTPTGYDMKRRKSKYKCYQHLLCITALITLICGYVWGLTKLYGHHAID